MEILSQGLYLPGVEQDPKPGIYKNLREAWKDRHDGEYPKIWDLFGFREEFTVYLARFTQGVLRAPSSLSPGMRELLAAYTSYRNQCAFCTKAHAAAAAELLGNEALVWNALKDPETSGLEDKEKLLLRFAGKITGDLPSMSAEDAEALRNAGWNDEAIYFAATTIALFNFYNRWITSTGVPPMSDESHREQGKLLATGYVRAHPQE